MASERWPAHTPCPAACDEAGYRVRSRRASPQSPAKSAPARCSRVHLSGSSCAPGCRPRSPKQPRARLQPPNKRVFVAFSRESRDDDHESDENDEAASRRRVARHIKTPRSSHAQSPLQPPLERADRCRPNLGRAPRLRLYQLALSLFASASTPAPVCSPPSSTRPCVGPHECD